MQVGLTYDLREEYLLLGYKIEDTAEFDAGETIEAIEQAIHGLGHETDRIGSAKSLLKRLTAGDSWDIVFNIAEGMYGFGRESLVPALLDNYCIPYVFSDPMVLSLALHKAMTKHVVRDMGIPTADFVVIKNENELDNIRLPFPLFAKPVAEGTGKGITAASKISDSSQLYTVCTKILNTYRQPVLLEIFLPGREFTVGIVGSGNRAVPIGVMEVLLKKDAEPGVYSYVNKENWKVLVEYRLVKDAVAQAAAHTALKCYRVLGCRDAARVDLRTDINGVPNFIEINPLAGIHPGHSDLCIMAEKSGMTYQDLIKAIMDSAVERYPNISNENNHWHRIQPPDTDWEPQLGILC